MPDVDGAISRPDVDVLLPQMKELIENGHVLSPPRPLISGEERQAGALLLDRKRARHHSCRIRQAYTYRPS